MCCTPNNGTRDAVKTAIQNLLPRCNAFCTQIRMTEGYMAYVPYQAVLIRGVIIQGVQIRGVLIQGVQIRGVLISGGPD